jgi:hypothetical protein
MAHFYIFQKLQGNTTARFLNWQYCSDYFAMNRSGLSEGKSIIAHKTQGDSAEESLSSRFASRRLGHSPATGELPPQKEG